MAEIEPIHNRITLFAGIITALLGVYGAIDTATTLQLNKLKEYTTAVQSEEKYWDDKSQTFDNTKKNGEPDDAFVIAQGLLDEIKDKDIPDFDAYDVFTFGSVKADGDARRLESKKNLLKKRLETYLQRALPKDPQVKTAQAANQSQSTTSEVALNAKSAPSPFVSTDNISLTKSPTSKMNLDIFWCQSDGNQALDSVNYSRARDAFIAVKEAPSIGRVRLRSVTYEQIQRPGYRWYYGRGISNWIDQGEKEINDEITKTLGKAGISLTNLGVKTTNTTSGYLSIFVCYI